MVSMSDELKERNILKLTLIVRFACAARDVEHPINMLFDIEYYTHDVQAIATQVDFFLQRRHPGILMFLFHVFRPQLFYSAIMRIDPMRSLFTKLVFCAGAGFNHFFNVLLMVMYRIPAEPLRRIVNDFCDILNFLSPLGSIPSIGKKP
jgi:hypothetical protein